MNLTPRRRPQPALVISLVALFVSLGGTSYAAISITGRNVADGSLSGRDIKNGTLRGADVRNGSLTAGDFSAATRSSLQGAPGATGPAGATGTFGTITIRRIQYTSGDPVVAACISREVAIGGGVQSQISSSWIRVSAPSPTTGTPVGWQGQAVNGANVATQAQVYAICARR